MPYGFRWQSGLRWYFLRSQMPIRSCVVVYLTVSLSDDNPVWDAIQSQMAIWSCVVVFLTVSGGNPVWYGIHYGLNWYSWSAQARQKLRTQCKLRKYVLNLKIATRRRSSGCMAWRLPSWPASRISNSENSRFGLAAAYTPIHAPVTPCLWPPPMGWLTQLGNNRPYVRSQARLDTRREQNDTDYIINIVGFIDFCSTLLVRNRAISSWMKTPHICTGPDLGLNPWPARCLLIPTYCLVTRTPWNRLYWLCSVGSG